MSIAARVSEGKGLIEYDRREGMKILDREDLESSDSGCYRIAREVDQEVC